MHWFLGGCCVSCGCITSKSLKNNPTDFTNINNASGWNHVSNMLRTDMRLCAWSSTPLLPENSCVGVGCILKDVCHTTEESSNIFFVPFVNGLLCTTTIWPQVISVCSSSPQPCIERGRVECPSTVRARPSEFDATKIHSAAIICTGSFQVYS